jgi:hypothetical protein
MADYNFKGFLDYIKLLDPIQNTETTIEEQAEPEIRQDAVLSHEPTLARIINLATYRK